jgi:hypothetical protein
MSTELKFWAVLIDLFSQIATSCAIRVTYIAMTSTMTFGLSEDTSLTDVDMLFFFSTLNDVGPFANLLDDDDEDDEVEEYAFLTRGVLQHRTFTIPPRDNSTTTNVSAMSIGSTDYEEYERLLDDGRPIAQPSRERFDPRICTIRITTQVEVTIANNGVVTLYNDQELLTFCAALTEYDASWIFYICAPDEMAVVVTSSTVEETLRYLLSSTNES